MTSNDDYLWDPDSAAPDEEVARLEDTLAPLAWEAELQGLDLDAPPSLGDETAPPLARHRVWLMAAGVAAVALLGAWLWARPAGDVEPTVTWAVRVEGTEAGHWAVGEWLDTQRSAWTHVEVPEIGHVTVAPQSRLRLLRTGKGEHRLELRQGTVRARITAPPRLFIVETPAALAVDLGCAYELDVDVSGNGRLRVDAGYVALERPDRIVRVPAGFSCAMRAGSGVGVPVFDAAPQAFRDAIVAYETGRSKSLDTVLAHAKADDAITLFHLLPRVPKSRRGELVDRLLPMAPLPEGVTRDNVIALQANALERWWEEGIQDLW